MAMYSIRDSYIYRIVKRSMYIGEGEDKNARDRVVISSYTVRNLCISFHSEPFCFIKVLDLLHATRYFGCPLRKFGSLLFAMAGQVHRGVIGEISYKARGASSGRAYDYDLTNMALSIASEYFHALVDIGRYVAFHLRSKVP